MGNERGQEIPIVKATIYGNERIYMQDELDLEAFQILRRGSQPEPPKTLTDKDFRALKRLGVDFEIKHAQQKKDRHGELKSTYEIKETGEDWVPPFQDD